MTKATSSEISPSKNLSGQKATDISMFGNRQKKGILLAGIAFGTVGVVMVILLLLSGHGYFLPIWVHWENGTYTDSSGQYETILKHRTAKVIYDTNVIWTSPDDIKVQDALCCDIDSDGTDDLLLLCWKVGRFGESKPFWVEQDEQTWSQHIFIYACENGEIKPKWMSSYIGQDVSQMSVISQKTGSKTEQGTDIVRQHLLLTSPNGQTSSWLWDSWGFTKEETDISFVVFGDNLIHEPIYQYGLYNSGSFDFLYENIKEVIAQNDIAVINQETPLTDQPCEYSDYPRFGTPVEVGEAIANANFDIVTCATNHALDQGVKGINFTKTFFDSRDITCIGIQSEDEKERQPYQILVRGTMRFAVLNYTYSTNSIALPNDKTYMLHLLDNKEQIQADLQAARTDADFVLVFVHWGTEYEEHPDEIQEDWTQIFLESGVDVVIGTHPHTLQPYEVLQDDAGHEMLIYYSIGNYISAQPERTCVKGGMSQFTMSLTSEGYKITQYTLQTLTITRQKDGRYTVDFSEK